ncbi:GNAT family N-acetyltransferase [Actinocatenispora comari]|uniref:N-acetyltransferase n=1 Tax=Actinocatenispora comari TaxID=2807577 RepID=A0A8J4AIY7_9ACTN|nr:GNAT family N-acetyltransferase [Actinocatenispora comari]GIL32053.1 N-acetyltransferase [Actinocatenispora comari]
MTTVRSANPDERDQITHLINIAFHDLDANRHLVPETPQRLAVMGRYFGLYVDHALGHGACTEVALDDSGALVGAALWYLSGDPGPADYDTRLGGLVGADRVDRFTAFDAQLHEHTPDEPHDYLGFLAVAPDRQGAGIGGRLLREHHRRLDARCRPAYLVASNSNSARLYERHGYTYLPDGQHELVLPGGGRMWRMWRRPDEQTPELK